VVAVGRLQWVPAHRARVRCRVAWGFCARAAARVAFIPTTEGKGTNTQKGALRACRLHSAQLATRLCTRTHTARSQGTNSALRRCVAAAQGAVHTPARAHTTTLRVSVLHAPRGLVHARSRPFRSQRVCNAPGASSREGQTPLEKVSALCAFDEGGPSVLRTRWRSLSNPLLRARIISSTLSSSPRDRTHGHSPGNAVAVEHQLACMCICIQRGALPFPIARVYARCTHCVGDTSRCALWHHSVHTTPRAMGGSRRRLFDHRKRAGLSPQTLLTPPGALRQAPTHVWWFRSNSCVERGAATRLHGKIMKPRPTQCFLLLPCSSLQVAFEHRVRRSLHTNAHARVFCPEPRNVLKALRVGHLTA